MPRVRGRANSLPLLTQGFCFLLSADCFSFSQKKSLILKGAKLPPPGLPLFSARRNPTKAGSPLMRGLGEKPFSLPRRKSQITERGQEGNNDSSGLAFMLRFFFSCGAGRRLMRGSRKDPSGRRWSFPLPPLPVTQLLDYS